MKTPVTFRRLSLERDPGRAPRIHTRIIGMDDDDDDGLKDAALEKAIGYTEELARRYLQKRVMIV
jgi:hypothetical protein